MIISQGEYFIGGGHEATERTIEVPIGIKWINGKSNLIEIGAVLPYFCKTSHDVIDPSDGRANIKKYLHEIDIVGKNVLSISTIEHIGLEEYGNTYSNSNGAAESIQRILKESSSCLISVPIGYNLKMDQWIKDNQEQLNIFTYRKMSHSPVLWKYNNQIIDLNAEYGKPFQYANLVVFIEKAQA